jgi:hypothetical protein
MEEKLNILQMLQEDKISVDEASQLLEAVVSAERGQGTSERSATTPGGDAATPPVPPDLGRFRRLSYLPLVVSLVILILSGWGAYVLFLRRQRTISLGLVALAVVFLAAFLATALSAWATTVPWLHVRIQSAPGKGGDKTRIAISLPVPLTLAGWGLRIANRFVDEDTVGRLDAAAMLLRTMRHDLGKAGAEPIAVDVNDEDERVQVYIG